MNPQSEEDLQRRLQQLEADLNSSKQQMGKTAEPQTTSKFSFNNLNSYVERSRLWFNSLSGTSKIIVVGVSVVLSLAIAQTVLKLVSTAISLALLAGLVYLGYKFFVSSSFQSKQ